MKERDDLGLVIRILGPAILVAYVAAQLAYCSMATLPEYTPDSPYCKDHGC